MKVIKVKTKPTYEILIGENLLEDLPKDLLRTLNFGKVALVTDDQVATLYAERLRKGLAKEGILSEVFVFPKGESSKNINTVITLAQALLSKGFDRKDMIIALGGGVVGDIAGFLASIYLRGIPYIQVPTTLLAQVDSSVGGKTGVDLPEGKNLLGTFYQPAKVYIDVNLLKTLPEIELKNGLAEIIKYACILKYNLFKYLNKNVQKIFSRDPKALTFLIYHSVLTKAKVVSLDEKEAGLRRVLNFGHTLGHALEAYSNYSVPHGLAVAVGMLIEAKLSELLKINEEPLYEPIKNLLKKFNMPVSIAQLNIKPKAFDLVD
ncbi:MAG: 3-dehydroquinate synthase, partial [Thermodesulfobacteriaceae bacterium]|nr:3-dehydroquinate synthase [Thermodesulfobacteriaceae bacterium]